MSVLTDHKIEFDVDSVREETPRIIREHLNNCIDALKSGKFLMFNYVDTRVGCCLLSLQNPYILEIFLKKLVEKHNCNITGPVQISRERKLILVVSTKLH